MRVLVIAEDPTLDQHVLKPVVRHLLGDLGRPARIDVLADPHLTGIAQALNPETIAQIVEDNRMIDLFIVAVDRDCDRFGNTAKARARVAEHGDKLVAVLAVEELEVWPLALHREELGTPWSDVRGDCDPKETYWEPFARDKGWLGTVGKGRKRAMRELGKGWSGLLQLCTEIVGLKEDVRGWLDERG